MPETFDVSDIESKRAERFYRRHRRLHKPDVFTVTWCFTPCGPGVAITVRCDRCRKSRNVTDYDSW